MSNNLGFSSRATFNEKLVKIKHKLEVEELDAKHSNIEFSNEPEQDIEIVHDDEIQHIFTEEGDFTINGGSLHCKKIVMASAVPWSTEAFYQYYIYTENNTLVSGTNTNVHLVYPTQTFRSTGNTESIYTEFKVQTAPAGFQLSMGVVIASKRSSNEFTEVITGNHYFTVLNSNASTLVVNDIIKLELKTNNHIHIYQNGNQISALGYSQLFTNLQNHNQGSDTVFSWYLIPTQTDNLRTFRLKLLDSWSESELHNESEIDIGTVLSVKQNNNDLINVDSNSVDFECPIHLKSLSTIDNMLALNNNVDSSAIVWCDALKSACLYDGTHWQMLNRRAQNIILSTTGFSKTWTGASATTMDFIHTSFETTYQAISDKYIFKFYCYVYDDNSGANRFVMDVYDTTNNAVFVSEIDVMKASKDDQRVVVAEFIKSGLTVGTSYRINVRGSSSSANNTFHVYSGSVYPNARLEIHPVYNITTF